MHGSMPYDQVQGQGHGLWYDQVQGQGQGLWIAKIALFKIYLIRHLQWEPANDYRNNI